MRKEDVKIGMKVVPHSKSVRDGGQEFEDYINLSLKNVPNLFRENGYLEIVDYNPDRNAFVLGGHDGKEGDYFLAEDFEPYEEVKKVEEFEDKKTGLKEDELNLLSETFSKIFKEPIKFINRTIYEAKDLVDTDFPSQRRLDRAENFYNALKSVLQVMNNEVEYDEETLPYLKPCERVVTEEEINNLQKSINRTKDAYAMVIADCLNIDHTRDDYFNVFFDAITNDYGFTWMIEKLKYEEVI